MEAKTQTKENTITLDELTSVLDSGAIIQARNLLNSLYPSEIADVIESSPRNRRDLIWNLVTNHNRGETLAELSEEVRGNLLDELIDESGTEGLAKIAENLDTDDLADIIQSLPKNLITKTIKSLDKQNQDRLAKVLSFSDDTAGGLMNTDTINVRSSVTVEVLLKYLRRLKKLPEQTDIVFVTDIMDKYFGYVSIQDLLVANTGSLVSEIMTEDTNIIDPDMDTHEVARIFENHDLVSAAVVNKEGVLLGRITVDDVVDIIRDEADDSVLNMAGLNKEDDIFAPIIQSTKRRTIWLGANLITAVLAAAAIGIFEATIEKVVTLAILMPIVASMGGIAGMQSLALVMRFQATNQIGITNSKLLIFKEASIGVLNGILWSSIVASAVYFWFNSIFLGLVIAAALMINLIIGAISGVSLPLILRRLNIDPALAGGVILTTITDIIGFISLLGIATLMM
ncbi:MAG: magnesium transporter [Gammaproteobacteria bacterium]|jgi:magnesium transporter|nr:magnesium transporter [Gammaproteobacteria bacterium]|tara:strand:- start:1160 stop:2527 length:1368 start_codon:yes stop_codon:yes gene_type:complete